MLMNLGSKICLGYTEVLFGLMILKTIPTKLTRNGYRSEDQGEMEYKIIPVLIYVTVVILLAAYIVIWFKMRQSRIQSNSVASDTRKSKEKRFIVFAVSIVVAFSCCWLPFAIFATTFVYTGRIFHVINTEAMNDNEIVYLIPIFLNSLINPFLYFNVMRKNNLCGVFKNVGKIFSRNSQEGNNMELRNIEIRF